MTSTRLTTVTTRSYARALHKTQQKYGEEAPRNLFLHCPQCSKPCQVGQQIVTKRCQNNTKWYHRACAEMLNIVWAGQDEDIDGTGEVQSQ